MRRLEAFQPHLTGAVWRGVANRHSAVHLELYCDDAKSAEIALVNLGVAFDSRGDDQWPCLSLADDCPALGERITVHLLVHDLDDLRGALKPDARGRSWRGDIAALRRLLEVGD